MTEVKSQKLDGRAVPKKNNRPHTRLHVNVETPFAKRMQTEPNGLLDRIVHEALCRHYNLSPITLQPILPGGPNRYYVRSGWVPTVLVWMYAYMVKKGYDNADARVAAINQYKRYLDEGRQPTYSKAPHPGPMHLPLTLPDWVPAFARTGKITIPTIEQVLSNPRPANWMYVPSGSAREAYAAELEKSLASGMDPNDAADRAFAAAHIATLKNAQTS